MSRRVGLHSPGGAAVEQREFIFPAGCEQLLNRVPRTAVAESCASSQLLGPRISPSLSDEISMAFPTSRRQRGRNHGITYHHRSVKAPTIF